MDHPPPPSATSPPTDEVFRRLVESVRDYAIFTLDPTGVITSWNLGAQRIKGYAASEAIGRHFSMFYPDEANDRGWPQEELRRAARLGRYEDEGWRLRKDGSRIWANVVITAMADGDGRLTGYSKVTRDLTERRAHEDALREREENLRLLVEGVRDHAMFLVGEDGRIRTWNSGGERLFGMGEAEAVGRPLHTLAPPLPAGTEDVLQAALRDGLVQQEGLRRRADGTAFLAHTATTAVREPSGALRGFVQIVRDLSERERLAALESEGRRLTEFIAMLSHELRNPLAPIRNAVAILRRTTDTPEGRWGAEVIGRQVDHMTRLIDDLLDVSRVTSGKIRIARAPVDLASLVRHAAGAAEPVVDRHGHRVDVEVPALPAHLGGGRNPPPQVVVNLLTNAAKYTPAGGAIAVSLATEGGDAVLRVQDNGTGLTPELLARVFEPFVQGDRTLDRAEGGLGVGLTLVHRIVQLHGGQVQAESDGPGRGATFTVRLPAGGATPAAAAHPQAPGAAAARRVLVVDDNPDAADSLAVLLRLAGHEVQVAGDGAGALALARAVPPDIVLLDLGLPDMDGCETARRLRALPALGPARFMALTGYGQASDRQATAAAGFERHFTKPVNIDTLLRALAGPGGESPTRAPATG